MEHNAPSLGLGPDRTESYPLFAVRKSAPAVAEDHRGDTEGGPSGVRAGVLSGAHSKSDSGGGGVGRRQLDTGPVPSGNSTDIEVVGGVFEPRQAHYFVKKPACPRTKNLKTRGM